MSDGEQLALFGDAGRSHRGDPWTSELAAARVRCTALRRRVLEELGRAREEGRTDSELGEALGIRETSAGTRRKELEELGLCRRTTAHRLTTYGNPALVHVITPTGIDLLLDLSAAEHPSAKGR